MARAHAGVAVNRQHQAAATTLEGYQLAVLQAPAAQLVRVQADHRLFGVGKQARGGAGAAHAVPLVAQASGVEAQGEARVAFFLGRAIGVGDELRAAAGGWELAIAIQPRGAAAGAAGQGPLLRALGIQQGIADAAEVEVTLFGQVFVFLKHLLRASEGKQAGLTGAQPGFQALGKVAGDGPVGARLGGRRHGAAHMADAGSNRSA